MKKNSAVVIFGMILVILTAFSSNAAGDNPEISRGVWRENVYTNEYADLAFTLPDGWIYLSEDELTTNFNSDVDFTKKVSKIDTFFDMACRNQTAESTVFINISKLSFSIRDFKFSEHTEKEFLDLLKEFYGTKYTFGDIRKISVGGNNYTVLSAVGSTAKFLYLVRNTNNYQVFITVMASDEDTVDAILKNFK